MPSEINPQIVALHDLQKQDARLIRLERKLGAIPKRTAELDADLEKLETMLATESRKMEDSIEFQRQQEAQLSEEEEQIRQSKARINQVKNTRELNATQRELESTRRMANSRSEEISKLKAGVEEAQARIATLQEGLKGLREQANAEKAKLESQRGKLEKKIARLQKSRQKLTDKVDKQILARYERIRTKLGTVAFAAASEERCTACKMHVPHIIFSALMKGEEILPCEACGRLLYWQGHFPKEAEARKEEEEQARARKKKKAEQLLGQNQS